MSAEQDTAMYDQPEPSGSRGRRVVRYTTDVIVATESLTNNTVEISVTSGAGGLTVGLRLRNSLDSTYINLTPAQARQLSDYLIIRAHDINQLQAKKGNIK